MKDEAPLVPPPIRGLPGLSPYLCKFFSIFFILFWPYSLIKEPSFPWVSPDWAWWWIIVHYFFLAMIIYSMCICETGKTIQGKQWVGFLFLFALFIYFSDYQLAILSYIFGDDDRKSSYVITAVTETGTSSRHLYRLDAKNLGSGEMVKINFRPRDFSLNIHEVGPVEICVRGSNSVFGTYIFNIKPGRCYK